MDIVVSPANDWGVEVKQSFTDPNTTIHIKVFSPGGGDNEYFNSKAPITLTNLNPEDKIIVGITGTLAYNETIRIDSAGNEWLVVEDITQKVGINAANFRNNNRLTRVNTTNSYMFNVVFVGNLFSGCSNVTSVKLPNSLSNVTDMRSTFYGCTNLTNIELPNDLSNVTTMNNAFYNCTNLTSIVPLKMEFPNLTSITQGWEGCSKFNGNLSGWKFRSDVSILRYAYNANNWSQEHRPQLVL